MIISFTSTLWAEEKVKQIYTCSMHPQVRLPEPGNCPICSMPLILAKQNSPKESGEVSHLELSPHARAMASVETAVVERRKLSHLVKTVGKVMYDETTLATITSRVDGYAERLFVNFTGIEVNKGDHLVEVYSPDLVVAQQELLIAGGRPELIQISKTKLNRLGLSEKQILEFLERKKITERVTLLSPVTGTVIERNVTQNAAFKAGEVLYQIANLDTVWVYVDVYEDQLPWLRYGQHVTMIAEAFPGRTFEGQVSFISPVVNEETRTVKVPIHVVNKDHALKPGMFVSAEIHAALNSEGEPAATGVEGSFTCPMHPQVLEKKDGNCSICGMDLVKIPGSTEENASQKILAIPVSAVLDSGERKIVFVEKERGVYEGREIRVGPRAKDTYPVLSGLKTGERVVVRGAFLLDSQAQISGSPSLFYPDGATGPSEHQH